MQSMTLRDCSESCFLSYGETNVCIYNGEYKTYIIYRNDKYLVRRVYEHKNKLKSGFTSDYDLNKLVYYEVVEGRWEAIIREKQIKNMSRKDKLEMIRIFNPEWKDLYNSGFRTIAKRHALHSRNDNL